VKDLNMKEGQMTAPTADDLEIHARTLSAAVDAILFGLAKGKYDGQMEVTEKLLQDLGVVLPPAADIEEALGVFLFLIKLTAPAAGMTDGKGRYVPSTNLSGNHETPRFV
jgi:hypothetical protein